VRLALEKNLDLSIQRLQPLIARANLTSALGAYDPRLNLDAQYGESSSPRLSAQVAADGRASVESQNTNLTGSLNQLTPLGSTIALETQIQNTESTFNDFQDEYSSFGGVTFRQPLLRGFGPDVNLAPIRISRRDASAADAAFQYQIERTITDVALAYYELIYTRNDLQARQESLNLAAQLLQDNKSRVEIGTMSSLDISQANAEAASRREEVIRAERAIRDQENVMKRLISRDIGSWLEKRLRPVDEPRMNLEPTIALSNIHEALRQRADLQEAVERAEAQKIQLKYDQNQILPQLDLRASYGFSGLDRDLDRSINKASEGQDPEWFVGLAVEIPLGNRERRGRVEASRLTKEQTLLQVKKLEQNIIVEVDNAVGQVETNRQRVVAAQASRQFAEETVNAEQEKLRAGSSTSFVVLQLQRDLTEARVRELRAMADLQKSRAELLRVQGRTLVENRVFLDRDRQPRLTP
jgi:outer membrane protein TolC